MRNTSEIFSIFRIVRQLLQQQCWHSMPATILPFIFLLKNESPTFILFSLIQKCFQSYSRNILKIFEQNYLDIPMMTHILVWLPCIATSIYAPHSKTLVLVRRPLPDFLFLWQASSALSFTRKQKKTFVLFSWTKIAIFAMPFYDDRSRGVSKHYIFYVVFIS